MKPCAYLTGARLTTRARRGVPAFLLLTAACSVTPAATLPASDSPSQELVDITVGFGPSVELQLMSELYAQVLEASGHAVTRAAPATNAASLVESLRDGEVDLAAAVTGEASGTSGGDPAASEDGLQELLSEEVLTMLPPSEAEQSRGVAMRFEDADLAGIATISDLTSAAAAMTWGLPNDCSANLECAAFVSTYGLALEQITITPVPMCAPESGAALNGRTADATLVCTTQPEIERLNLLVLEDDRGAFRLGTIAPLVRTEWLDAAPPDFVNPIDAVSSRIDTDVLTSLAVQVTVEEREVAAVAREWLEDNGFV